MFLHSLWSLIVSVKIAHADPKDPGLRTTENSFLLGPLLVFSRFSFSLFKDSY
jgi:hypothetical protein